MNELLGKIGASIELGKINADSPYPPDMKGQPGADELTKAALDAGISPEEILGDALIIGMRNIGEKFGRCEVFIPDILMAAKAMDAAMAHIKPYFQSGDVRHKGTLVIGTVRGDLHDIDARRMDPAGRGLTLAGKICGMIAVFLYIALIGIWFIGAVGGACMPRYYR